jgi:hypothetical protein
LIGNPSKAARLASKGAFATVVQEVAVIAGRPYARTFSQDLRDSGSAPVPLLVQGGGLERFSYCGPTPHDGAGLEANPDNTDASQVVVVPRESSATTYAVGAVPHVKSQFTEESPELEAADAHPGTVSIIDNAMGNAGSKFILDHRGQVVLVVKQDARVQMEEGGVLRIMRDGAATERIPLAGPLIDYIQQLEQHVVRLTNWAASLVISTTTGPAMPTTAFAFTPPTLNPAAVRSAAIRVSADAE